MAAIQFANASDGRWLPITSDAVIEIVLGAPNVPTREQPTITPEDTLRDAGIDDARQAEYQRRMSALLGGA